MEMGVERTRIHQIPDLRPVVAAHDADHHFLLFTITTFTLLNVTFPQRQDKIEHSIPQSSGAQPFLCFLQIAGHDPRSVLHRRLVGDHRHDRSSVRDSYCSQAETRRVDCPHRRDGEEVRVRHCVYREVLFLVSIAVNLYQWQGMVCLLTVARARSTILEGRKRVGVVCCLVL